MFAYVKDNNLYITGKALIYQRTDDEQWECWNRETLKVYFEGKGSQIKKVVGFGDDVGTIFVLMNDGSVWGIGNNEKKLISNTKKEFFSEFTKVISGGVKDIEISSDNVVMIKKNNSLWVWGKSFRKSEGKYSNTPYKVAEDVKEVSISSTNLLFLKNDNVAYGMGDNKDYTLTNRYSKSWKAKPVKLREKIKHIYAAQNITMLLSQKNELYWAGTVGFPTKNWWKG